MNSEDKIFLALKRVVRPLVRLLIYHGVRLPRVVAALKQVYVDVAENEFRLDGKSPTDSRVSVLTGVHRQDVSNIRRDGKPSSMPSEMSLSATVVGHWLGDPQYADERGQAKTLFHSADQGSPSFEELAQSCSRDVHARTILDELVNQNLVDWDQERDLVILLNRAYLPASGNEEMMHFFEMNLHDHLAAAVNNVIAGDPSRRFLERAVYYNSLLPNSVKKLDELARKRADDILNELNSEALGLQDADRKNDQTKTRFRFGVFFYHEDDDLTEKND